MTETRKKKKRPSIREDFWGYFVDVFLGANPDETWETQVKEFSGWYKQGEMKNFIRRISEERHLSQRYVIKKQHPQRLKMLLRM